MRYDIVFANDNKLFAIFIITNILCIFLTLIKIHNTFQISYDYFNISFIIVSPIVVFMNLLIFNTLVDSTIITPKYPDHENL